MEMEVEDADGEEAALSSNLSAFLSYIVQHVQPKDMIAYYDLYTREQRKSIRLLMREKPNEAVQAAFDIIIDEIDDTNKYKYLLEMLREAEYPKIVKILTGKAIPRNTNNKNLIQKFTKVILDGLNVGGSVLSLLVYKGVINGHDAEEINATLTTKGNFQAVLDLLCIFLPNRRTSWYRRFIEALLDSNHRGLAEKIDKVLCNKIDAEKESDGSSCKSADDETASVQPVEPEDREIPANIQFTRQISRQSTASSRHSQGFTAVKLAGDASIKGEAFIPATPRTWMKPRPSKNRYIPRDLFKFDHQVFNFKSRLPPRLNPTETDASKPAHVNTCIDGPSKAAKMNLKRKAKSTSVESKELANEHVVKCRRRMELALHLEN